MSHAPTPTRSYLIAEHALLGRQEVVEGLPDLPRHRAVKMAVVAVDGEPLDVPLGHHLVGRLVQELHMDPHDRGERVHQVALVRPLERPPLELPLLALHKHRHHALPVGALGGGGLVQDLVGDSLLAPELARHVDDLVRLPPLLLYLLPAHVGAILEELLGVVQVEEGGEARGDDNDGGAALRRGLGARSGWRRAGGGRGAFGRGLGRALGGRIRVCLPLGAPAETALRGEAQLSQSRGLATQPPLPRLLRGLVVAPSPLRHVEIDLLWRLLRRPPRRRDLRLRSRPAPPILGRMVEDVEHRAEVSPRADEHRVAVLQLLLSTQDHPQPRMLLHHRRVHLHCIVLLLVTILGCHPLQVLRRLRHGQRRRDLVDILRFEAFIR
mmetsp:Transcript_47301/g.151566  ORF Transcript_47301/g.151566 Transcript_47301/m.151566 type:complete len:382 (-) Transcript_47301:383-1528(-)